MDSQVLDSAVRLASPTDLEQLLSLENQSFSSDKISRRSFRNFLKGQHNSCLVVERDSRIIAYILLLFRRGSSLARVYSLAVDADYRGQGIARQLLSQGERCAVDRHCLFMRLEVGIQNTGAKALYEAEGYRVFDQIEDYYEDHTTALRLEKALSSKASLSENSSTFYAQTTDFTCGPASLMMAMHHQTPDNVAMNRRTEMQLWREATTIFMTSGHGGCSPEGLALSAWQRGFTVTLYLQCNDVPFIEGVRDVRKKNVIELVHQDFVERIAETDIAYQHTAITPQQFQQHINQGDSLITLISTWQLTRDKAPHWVFIADCDEQFVYVNDPDPDEDEPHPFHDNIHLPISRQNFERMACFGRGKLKATLAISKR